MQRLRISSTIVFAFITSERELYRAEERVFMQWISTLASSIKNSISQF